MKLPRYGRRYAPLEELRVPEGVEQSAQKRTQEMRPQLLRTRILNNLLILASIVGVITFVFSMPSIVQQNQWGLLFLYGVIVCGLIVVSFARRISYSTRAAILLVLIFCAGLGTLLANGLYGNGRIILITLPIIAAILVGFRGRTTSLILSAGAVVIVGILMSIGYIEAPISQPATSNDSILVWTIAGVIFLLLAATATISLGVFVDGLEGSLQRQKKLADQHEQEHIQLEERVQLHADDLQRRLLQIRTTAEISRSISGYLDMETLLPQVCDLVHERFELYYVGIFLISQTRVDQQRGSDGRDEARPGGLAPTQTYATLVAGTGEAGEKMLAQGHKLAIGGDSMIGWATAYRQARIALDVGKEAVRFSNPYLPGTRSELALPILSKEKVLGAITIQSDKPAAFDEDDIAVLQSIADSLANAIENARLIAELENRLEEIQGLHRQYLERSWAEVQKAAASREVEYTFQTDDLATEGDLHSIQLPITLRDEVIGNITLEAETQGEDWTTDELRLIESVIDQAALALENARLLEETQRKAEQERLSANISTMVWASSDIDTILRTALQELATSLQATDGLIQLEIEE